jgi:hypothetical protein
MIKSLTHRKSLGHIRKFPRSQIEHLSPGPATIGAHRSTIVLSHALSVRLDFSYQPSAPSITFTGAYTSNPSAGHIPSSSYFPADPRPPSIIRSTGGESLPPSCTLVILSRVLNSGRHVQGSCQCPSADPRLRFLLFIK